MKSLHSCILLLGLALLNGCSQYTTQQPIIGSLSDKPLPEQWQIKGKLGVRSDNGNGSLSVNWQQSQDDYIIYTQAALGQGATTLRGDSSSLVISAAGKAPVTSFNPNQLIADTFGWQIPITDLKYWARGIPNPEQPNATASYDKAGNLIELQQYGWSLSFSRYQLIQGWALPGKIRAIQGNTTLTLIIREWVM